MITLLFRIQYVIIVSYDNRSIKRGFEANKVRKFLRSEAVKSSCLAKVVFGFCLSGLLSLSYGKGSSVSLVI